MSANYTAYGSHEPWRQPLLIVLAPTQTFVNLMTPYLHRGCPCPRASIRNITGWPDPAQIAITTHLPPCPSYTTEAEVEVRYFIAPGPPEYHPIPGSAAKGWG